jgi:predicted transcriptional regulator
MDPHEDLEYIVNSTKQINVLRKIRRHQSPVRKHELVSENEPPSQSTVNRAIGNLSDRNWIEEKSRNRYVITTTGEGIVEGIDGIRDTIAEAQTKTKLLNQLGEHAPSIDVLAEATTAEYPQKDPMKGWNRASCGVEERAEEGLETYRGMNPIVSARGNEMGRKILSAVDTAELIIDEMVLDTSEANYSEALEAGRAADNFEIYVSPNEVPITLAIYDEEKIEASVHDADGHPVGGIRGSSTELSCWADDLYEQYRAQSYPLSQLIDPTK